MLAELLEKFEDVFQPVPEEEMIKRATPEHWIYWVKNPYTKTGKLQRQDRVKAKRLKVKVVGDSEHDGKTGVTIKARDICSLTYVTALLDDGTEFFGPWYRFKVLGVEADD